MIKRKMNMKKSPEQRFWEKVNKDTESNCWEWTASLNKNGYGQFGYYGQSHLAHRVSLILDGQDITGLNVCHKCDNPCCVNPAHLFLGTQADNMRDMSLKNRAAAAYPTLRKLTNDQIREIRASSLSQRQLAKKYNIGNSQISHIIHRHTYRDVT